MGPLVAARELVGRSAEIDEIDRVLGLARGGHPASLLLSGEAGVGKTALLEHAAASAGGMLLLQARGVEAESELPYSGLFELLRPLLGDLAALPERQVQALSAALALGPAVAADPFAVAAATLSLLAAAAGRGPVLVIVDDLQWLDSASVEALAFAVRRLVHEPVAVLVGLRSATRIGVGLATTGGGTEPPLGFAVLELRGLDRPGSAALLASRLGTPLHDDLAERLYVETAGNPLALIELPRLLPGGVIASLEAIGNEPLPVAQRLEQVFRRAAAGLAPEAQRALLVAAANDSADVDPVLAAIAVLGLPLGALDDAEASGLLSVRDAQLRFRHPLVRSSIYQAAEPAARRDAHRALAIALETVPGSHARRAWHLAAATVGHDRAVASMLEDAAHSARERGAFVAAARAWEKAARLWPEPPEVARRLYAASENWQLANHYDHAVALLEEAATLTDEPALAADIDHLLLGIDVWRGPALSAAARLRAAATRWVSIAPERAVRMLADATLAAITGGELSVALEAATAASAIAPAAGADAELVAALQLGKARILTGDVDGGYPTLVRAVTELLASPSLEHQAALVQAVPALMTVEAYALADAVLSSVISAQRRATALGLLAYSLGARSELEVRMGHWADAEADAAEAVQLAAEARQYGQLSYNLARAARLEAALGREDDCREHAERALDLAARHAFGSTFPFAHAALGLLDLGAGRIAAAVTSLEEAGRQWDKMGFREPGRLEWQADLVEALARAGRLAEAEQRLDVLEHQAAACHIPERAGRPGTACTLARAAAARCRGLLAEPDESEPFFRRALEWHAWSGTPFEMARTQLCYGEQLRRAGRRVDARPLLTAALAEFERLGALPWASRAETELAATGAKMPPRRARPIEQLTPQELQVVRLVASGATNREAGAALFVTPKTIEFHLAKIYRKLDLRSRTELAAWALRSDRLAASQAVARTA